jgi:hypothetical protein
MPAVYRLYHCAGVKPPGAAPALTVIFGGDALNRLIVIVVLMALVIANALAASVSVLVSGSMGSAYDVDIYSTVGPNGSYALVGRAKVNDGGTSRFTTGSGTITPRYNLGLPAWEVKLHNTGTSKGFYAVVKQRSSSRTWWSPCMVSSWWWYANLHLGNAVFDY